MLVADRIKALWHVFRADTLLGAQGRRRAAAMAAMGTFLLALLATVGFLELALVIAALAVVGAGIAAAALILRRDRLRLGEWSGIAVRRVRTVGTAAVPVVSRGASAAVAAASRGVSVAAAAVSRGTSVSVTRVSRGTSMAAAAASRGASATGRSGSSAVVAVRQAAGSRLPELRARYLNAQAAAARGLGSAATRAQQHARAAAAGVRARRDALPVRAPVTDDREALRANAAGAQLRRDGAYSAAAEQHRIALALYRELGDRRSEALTLNNLALALDRAGDPGALDLFEEAVAILAELGEQQQEGEVIANLALAFRRRGSEERSAEVLEIALGKLNPESQAYRKVEGLRRAS
jgi:tetratricopeptide (TPR) repeat protein